MQKLGVSWRRATSCATICPESCLGGIPGEQSLTYILPNQWVASFGLRNRDTYDFSACAMPDTDGIHIVMYDLKIEVNLGLLKVMTYKIQLIDCYHAVDKELKIQMLAIYGCTPEYQIHVSH